MSELGLIVTYFCKYDSVVTMKRQMSILNFFFKEYSVTIEVGNNSNTALPLAIDYNPNQKAMKNFYDIGNCSNQNSVRSLTNKKRLSRFNNV